MKILHITRTDGGGLTIVASKIVNNLGRLYSEELTQELLFYGNREYVGSFKIDSPVEVRSVISKDEVLFVNLWNRIKFLIDADVIHIHHTKVWILFSPIIFFAKKVVYSYHTNFGSGIERLNIVEKVARSMILNYSVLFSDRIICLTFAQKELLGSFVFFKSLWEKRVQVIPNFVEDDMISKSVSKSKSKSVLFVGRYTDLKGFPELIEIAKRIPESKFYLVGSNTFPEGINCPNNMINLGEKSNEEVLELMREHPILILPSHTEVFPMSILEAMSQGMCVVSSDLPGIREINNKQGIYTCNVGAIEEFVETISKLFGNSGIIRKSQELNLSRVEVFKSSKIVKEIFNLYKDISF
jgi:glycosyltransferase involved in cell wall biosynthesis